MASIKLFACLAVVWLPVLGAQEILPQDFSPISEDSILEAPSFIPFEAETLYRWGYPQGSGLWAYREPITLATADRYYEFSLEVDVDPRGTLGRQFTVVPLIQDGWGFTHRFPYGEWVYDGYNVLSFPAPPFSVRDYSGDPVPWKLLGFHVITTGEEPSFNPATIDHIQTSYRYQVERDVPTDSLSLPWNDPRDGGSLGQDFETEGQWQRPPSPPPPLPRVQRSPYVQALELIADVDLVARTPGEHLSMAQALRTSWEQNAEATLDLLYSQGDSLLWWFISPEILIDAIGWEYSGLFPQLFTSLLLNRSHNRPDALARVAAQMYEETGAPVWYRFLSYDGGYEAIVDPFMAEDLYRFLEQRSLPTELLRYHMEAQGRLWDDEPVSRIYLSLTEQLFRSSTVNLGLAESEILSPPELLQAMDHPDLASMALNNYIAHLHMGQASPNDPRVFNLLDAIPLDQQELYHQLIDYLSTFGSHGVQSFDQRVFSTPERYRRWTDSMEVRSLPGPVVEDQSPHREDVAKYRLSYFPAITTDAWISFQPYKIENDLGEMVQGFTEISNLEIDFYGLQSGLWFTAVFETPSRERVEIHLTSEDFLGWRSSRVNVPLNQRKQYRFVELRAYRTTPFSPLERDQFPLPIAVGTLIISEDGQ